VRCEQVIFASPCFHSSGVSMQQMPKVIMNYPYINNTYKLPTPTLNQTKQTKTPYPQMHQHLLGI